MGAFALPQCGAPPRGAECEGALFVCFMLAKKFRLPVKGFLVKKPKTLKVNYFSFKYLPNQILFGRFGVVISKKTEKSAVKRNKIKRIIFNFFQKQENSRELSGFDILIMPSKKVFGLKEEEIKKEIQIELKIK